jgi:hypothetical protein
MVIIKCRKVSYRLAELDVCELRQVDYPKLVKFLQISRRSVETREPVDLAFATSFLKRGYFDGCLI